MKYPLNQCIRGKNIQFAADHSIICKKKLKIKKYAQNS